MITGYITLEESTIRSFIENPEYAEHLMSVVIADGDKEEIKYFQKLYNEAKERTAREASIFTRLEPELQGAMA